MDVTPMASEHLFIDPFTILGEKNDENGSASPRTCPKQLNLN